MKRKSNKDLAMEEDNNRKFQKKKKNKKRKILLKMFLVLLIILLIAVVYITYKTYKNGWGIKGLVSTLVGHDANTLEELDEITFLLMGTNQNLTDTIMVCSYDPKTQKASMLSIPRDTFIGKNKNKATSYDKINSLYQGDNPEKVMKSAGELLGIDLSYYIVIDTNALVQLVDQIGGVYFDVPINMKYDDPTQNLHINLKAGHQLIKGKQAEQLLRFRHNNNGTSYSTEYGDNDYGRMRTQREFISAAISQTLKASNILKLTNLLDIVKKNVTTNMDFNLLKDYIPYAIEFNTENIQSGVLPGESELCNGVWIFIHNKKETTQLVNEMFLHIPEEEITNMTNSNNVVNSTNTTNSTKKTNTTNSNKK